ncbi:hypothetical protein Bhyg_08232 [Pseudolycoriella hygida]|uniref:THAP-type domain-containing protein n=1 Tax=Pseudolycoriella hygida TaxID=35572 RepID=A0A9Q0S3F3_9DIPT|nr:hypothetical protein Bhyg_08232 [Pseudolycoriella hygida]
MGREPKKNTVVCGEHFEKTDYETPFLCDKERLKQDVVPTQKIPKSSLELKGIIKSKLPRERSLRLKRKAVDEATSVDMDSPMDTGLETDVVTSNEIGISTDVRR